MAKKKKSNLSTIVICVLGVAIVTFLGFKLVHKCDDCEEIFIGTGYSASKLEQAVSDTLADLTSDEKKEKIFCKDCAEKHHAIGTLLGSDLNDYKNSLF